MARTIKTTSLLTLFATLLRLRFGGGSGRVTKPCRPNDVLLYSLSTLFLAELWEDLCAEAERGERLVVVTGPITDDGVRVPSRMEQIRLSSQSATYVKADDGPLLSRVSTLHRIHGHTVLLLAHSHILYGAASTRPSKIDNDNQIRFAAIGWEAIGCIVSLDGYVRFFDPLRDFKVSIFGKDFELIEDKPRTKVIRLTELGDRKTSRAQRLGEAVT